MKKALWESIEKYYNGYNDPLTAKFGPNNCPCCIDSGYNKSFDPMDCLNECAIGRYTKNYGCGNTPYDKVTKRKHEWLFTLDCGSEQEIKKAFKKYKDAILDEYQFLIDVAIR
jgi:hypothetical protein